MPSIQHLLETQFSVRMGNDLTGAWLASRVELLRRFTVPALAAQSTEDFTWLVLCDETTPPGVLEQLREEVSTVPSLRIALTGPACAPLTAVRAAVRHDADVLITTRLDSDDAVADGYLEAVQDYARSFHRSGHEELLVNFPRGYRLDAREAQLYDTWMANSPFHSFFERPKQGAPLTVRGTGHRNLRDAYASNRRLQVLGPNGLGAPHVRLHQHYFTHQDESMDAWMVTVHGGNLINCIGPLDRRLPAGTLPRGFTLSREAMGRPDDGE